MGRKSKDPAGPYVRPKKTALRQADLPALGEVRDPERRFLFEAEATLRLRGYARIAGIDEAGRGPLAGPVVAAAVILSVDFSHPLLDDSKKLSSAQRAEVAAALRAHPGIRFAVAEATVEEIDALNILGATLLAMRRAVEALTPLPDYVLVDGRDCPPVGIPGRAVIQGDAKVAAIAAASILAKEARDATMVAWAAAHPAYGFEIHKGYGTAAHLAALKRHGPTPIHRRSFAPVRACSDTPLPL